MNSEPVRVLEFWHRPGMGWQRDPELEREIKCDWMDDEFTPEDDALLTAAEWKTPK